MKCGLNLVQNTTSHAKREDTQENVVRCTTYISHVISYPITFNYLINFKSSSYLSDLSPLSNSYFPTSLSLIH